MFSSNPGRGCGRDAPGRQDAEGLIRKAVTAAIPACRLAVPFWAIACLVEKHGAPLVHFLYRVDPTTSAMEARRDRAGLWLVAGAAELLGHFFGPGVVEKSARAAFDCGQVLQLGFAPLNG